jgi:hypothetical protein
MVSVIGLDSEKVQELCDAANEEVDEKERVQIANFLCPVSVLSDATSSLLVVYWILIDTKQSKITLQGNYAVSGGVKGIEVVEAKAKSFKARMTVSAQIYLYLLEAYVWKYYVYCLTVKSGYCDFSILHSPFCSIVTKRFYMPN